MFSANIIQSNNEMILAVCDMELLGKEFTEGKKRLLLIEQFYGGETINSEELISLLHTATIANLVGKEAIKVAVDAGIIDPEAIIEIAGIPHAQLAKIMG